MDKSNEASRTLICPFCSEAELRGFGRNSLRCDECGGVLGGALLETLNKIVALPDAAGGHACECGHPEMRRLPDERVPMSGLRIGGHPHLRPGVLEVPGPHRGVLVRLARRPLRRPGAVHEQPPPGQVGRRRGPPRLLPRPPRRPRSPHEEGQARRSILRSTLRLRLRLSATLRACGLALSQSSCGLTLPHTSVPVRVEPGPGLPATEGVRSSAMKRYSVILPTLLPSTREPFTPIRYHACLELMTR